MKARIMLRIISVMAAVLLTAGCAQIAGSNKESESSVKESITKIDPVPRPEGGWTEENILDVTYINGKPLKFPCDFKDLGDGFEYIPDEETDERINKFGYGSYSLTYNGMWVGAVGFRKGDRKVVSLSFDSRMEKKYPAVPISVNGVTMGSSVFDFEKYVAKDEEPDSMTGDSKITSNIDEFEHLYYNFAKTDNKVTVIWFQYFTDRKKADGSDDTDNNKKGDE